MGLGTWLDVVDDVMMQRWHTRHLPTDPAKVLGPDVKGKTFIVTGPTSGIGTTTAETLARSATCAANFVRAYAPGAYCSLVKLAGHCPRPAASSSQEDPS